jgi:hypothetical protein
MSDKRVKEVSVLDDDEISRIDLSGIDLGRFAMQQPWAVDWIEGPPLEGTFIYRLTTSGES